MSSKIQCPSCRTLMQLPTGATPGAIIQCPTCHAQMAIPGGTASQLARQMKAAAPGTAKGRALPVEAEEPARPKPKKKPLRQFRSSSGGANFGLALVVVVMLVLVAGGIGVVVWLATRGQDSVAEKPRNDPARREQPRNDPPPIDLGGNLNPGGNANPPATQGGDLFTLSNGKFFGGIGGLNFEADFKLSGALRPDMQYFWIIQSSSGKRYEVRYNGMEFQMPHRGNTLAARSFGGFGDGGGSSFECWLEERPFASFRGEEGRKVSNVLPMQRTEAPRGGPPFGPRF